MRPLFTVSLMCMDFLAMREQLHTLNRRADAYHLDIMDGHFCPNLALTPGLARAIGRVASLPLEAHVMAERPGDWIEALAEAGAAMITLHVEAIGTQAFRLTRRIAELGCKVGLALCPATPLVQAEHLLEAADVLTIMTVDVGFAGQPFVPAMLEKIDRAREWRAKRGFHYAIEADGACNVAHFAAMRAAGVDRFVLGSALFGKEGDLDRAYDAVLTEYENVTGEVIR